MSINEKLNTMSEPFDWQALKTKIIEAARVLPHFLKSPVAGMRQLPSWDWPTTVILHGALACGAAILQAFVERSFLGVLAAIVLVPIIANVISLIVSGFFYYTFMFFFQRELSLKDLFIHIVFASIPLQLLSIISPLLPPVTLLGMLASAALLCVGFVDNFQLPKPKVLKLLGAILVVYALFWIFQAISLHRKHDEFRSRATPESLDILEKELKSE